MRTLPAPASRPKTGLLLLLVSLVASIAAYGMVGLGLRGRVPSDIVVYGLTLGGAYLLAWGVVGGGGHPEEATWVPPPRGGGGGGI